MEKPNNREPITISSENVSALLCNLKNALEKAQPIPVFTEDDARWFGWSQQAIEAAIQARIILPTHGEA